jgi:hypothetical protein
MKVKTPLGEYPFEFRGVERRGRTLLISGTVAGLESSVVLDRGDLVAVVRPLLVPLGVVALAAAAVSRARR